MNLGYDLDAALPGLRREAESRMQETVTAGLWADGEDEETGQATRVLVETRYEGVARVRVASREVLNANTPGGTVGVQEPFVSVPVGSPMILRGDEFVVDSSPDPIMVGRRFRVTGWPASGQVTAHRYPVEELT